MIYFKNYDFYNNRFLYNINHIIFFPEINLINGCINARFNENTE